MARTTPRPRREVSARRLRALKAVGFRYSPSRNAYVMRIVGNRFGPVYREMAPEHPERTAPPLDTDA